jgi:hypothetical protein
VIDAGCSGCSVKQRAATIEAGVASGADDRDTAVRLLRLPRLPKAATTVSIGERLAFGAGETINANLAVLQVLDASRSLICELYVAPDSTLRLWSPAGGLRSSEINVSTGVQVPRGAASLPIDLSIGKQRAVVLKVAGTRRLVVNGLTGSRTGPPRLLRLGIDHYDADGSARPVRLRHERIRAWSGS